MRVSNTKERNITYDKSRSRYRIEMRCGGKHNTISRTARVKTLEEAIKIRDDWAAQRQEASKKAKEAQKAAETPAFNIEKKPVTITFD